MKMFLLCIILSYVIFLRICRVFQSFAGTSHRFSDSLQRCYCDELTDELGVLLGDLHKVGRENVLLRRARLLAYVVVLVESNDLALPRFLFLRGVQFDRQVLNLLVVLRLLLARLHQLVLHSFQRFLQHLHLLLLAVYLGFRLRLQQIYLRSTIQRLVTGFFKIFAGISESVSQLMINQE